MISSNASSVAKATMDHFEAFEERTEREIDRAVEEARELARQRVPVDEGDLRDDISIDLGEDRIYNTLEYAIYQDRGTRYIEPTFYLSDSARDAWLNSIDRLRRNE